MIKEQFTFFIIKPEVLKAKKEEEILSIIRENGFLIRNLRRLVPTEEIIKEHYQHLIDKPFFPELLKYMTSGEVIFGILEKTNAVEEFRTLIGDTNPDEAAEGTIRNKYGYREGNSIYNAIHGSDTMESFYREIRIWYGKIDLCSVCGKLIDDFYDGLPLCDECGDSVCYGIY